MDEKGIKISEVFETYTGNCKRVLMKISLDWYVDGCQHQDSPDFIDIEFDKDELTKLREIIDSRISAMGG